MKGAMVNIMYFKKPAAWVIVVSIVLVAALSIAFAANGTYNGSDPNGYKSLFQERFAEARKIGLHFTAKCCIDIDAAPDFTEADVQYYKCKHYSSKTELRSALTAVFTDDYAQGFYTRLGSTAFIERDGGLYIAPSLLFDGAVWQVEDTISFGGETVDTFLWDSLTVTEASDDTVSYTMFWHSSLLGRPSATEFTLVKSADEIWRLEACFVEIKPQKSALTLDDIRALARKGNSLTLMDFIDFQGADASSTINHHLMVYVVKGGYRLIVDTDGYRVDRADLERIWDSGGSGIDIRYNDVDEFLKSVIYKQ